MSEPAIFIAASSPQPLREPTLEQRYYKFLWKNRNTIETCVCQNLRCGCNNQACRQHNMPEEFKQYSRWSSICYCNIQPPALFEAGSQVDFRYNNSTWLQGLIFKIKYCEEYIADRVDFHPAQFNYFIRNNKHGTEWYEADKVAPFNTKYQGPHAKDCNCIACTSDSD